MDKTEMLNVRLDPQNMAKLDALAKDAGVNRSEMLRRILAEIVTVGKVNWDSGKVKLVTEADMVDVTAEELAARE